MKITADLLRASMRAWYSTDSEDHGPAWLQLVWTFLFSAVVALGFFALGLSMNAMRGRPWPDLEGLARLYGINLVIALLIGFTIHGLFAVATPLVGPQRIRRFGPLQRVAFFGGLPLLGTALVWPAAVWLVHDRQAVWRLLERPGVFTGSLTMAAIISTIFYLHFAAKAAQFKAEKRATEAQLRLLQGQIEPHFLFNTLANVLSLIDTDSAKARRMLESFTDYLRASLSGLRREDGTVGTELDLAEAYLSLLKTRMEDRLVYRIDAPEALRSARVPPLLLQPLVENAVVHGLEPQVAGGSITIRVTASDGELCLDVRDDGLGPDATPRRAARPGAGIAIGNIRERLKARYGASASLAIVDGAPGTRATLTLPLEAP